MDSQFGLSLGNVSVPVIGGYDSETDPRNFVALPGLSSASDVPAPAASHVPPAWAKEMMQFLDETPLETLEKDIQGTDIVWLKTTSTVGDALFFLRKYGCTGAPVFKDADCWGMLELMDLMTVLVRAPRPSFWAQVCGHRADVSPLDMQLQAVIDFSEKASCFLINTSFYADSLADAFRSQWRVGLYSQRELVAVVSQTGLARTLAAHGGKMCDKTTLEEARLIVSPVLSCGAGDRVGLVMAAMARRRVNAVAVVGEGGKLLGSLSTHHVLAMLDLEDMSLSARDFLAKFPPEKSGEPLLTCTPRDSVSELLKKFASGRTHRIWITDKKGVVVGVTMLSSLFRDMYDSNSVKAGAGRRASISVLQ